jgi:outer membrane receptor protein involved in Fe transport
MTMITSKSAARVSIFWLMFCCAIAQAEPLSRQVDFNIGSQRLAAAIVQFSEQAHVQVISSGIDVTDQTTPGVIGRYTVADALNALLRGTGLRYKAMNENTVSLQTIKPSPQTTQTPAAPQSSLALAQADSTQRPHPEATAVSSDTEKSGIGEIVVTAQKRKERLQDVPVAVTAVDAESLVESNQIRLQDYYTNVPGLSVTPFSQTQQGISIRGVTTAGSTTPTVGVMVDDVPYGSSTLLGGGPAVPDIDPGDLARIEVLRGPQGTLYGVSSIGGLLKFVTIDPSTDGVSGRVQAGTSNTYNSAGLGYNVRGSINVPVTNDLAIRASAFTREDPGYIDNPVLHIDGVNEDHAYGGRLSALWKPERDVSLKVNALFQDVKGNGNADVDVGPGLGDLQQNYPAGTGEYERKFQAYSATLNAKLGSADFTSLTGYNVNQFSNSLDYTAYLGGPGGPAQTRYGVLASLLAEQNKTDKFSEEVRVAIPFGSVADWLVGAFYTHENSQFGEQALATDPVSGRVAGLLIDNPFPTTYQEYAAFTDVTVHLSNRFDVQFGGRESHITQTYMQTESGPLLPTPYVVPKRSSSAGAFTYLVTPRFEMTPDVMIYARLASGYRAGAPNAPPDVPRQSNPDKTQQYELGSKVSLLDHKLFLDASIYYIDWKDIQIGLFDSASGEYYQGNAGRAKSQGAELSAELRPYESLTVSAWVAWNDAVLREPFPPSAPSTYGMAGDRLPFSARFTSNMAVEQQFSIANGFTGLAGGNVSYVGSRVGEFTASAQRQDYPGYTKLDLHAGAKFELWTISLYVNNATDRRAALYGGLGGFPAYAFNYIQPRTVGLSVVKTF